MTEKKVRKKYYMEYTIAYFLMASVFYGTFWLNGKTFIWSSDGWDQHIKVMVYYAKWLRVILGSIIREHKLFFPTYSFSIGYGADILTTLQCYGIGDPITSMCVFVPVSYMQYFYAFTIYIRLYLAGVFFSEYCFYTQKPTSNNSLLAAVLVYLFSGYSMSYVCHPMFLVVLLWTPLILIGVERIWNGEGLIHYTFYVFLAGISNFYFFYIIVVFIVIYIVLKCLFDKSSVRDRLYSFGQCAVGGFIGSGMSAVVLMPVLWTAIHDVRVKKQWDFLHPIRYYFNLPNGFVSFNRGTSLLGFGGVGLVALGIIILCKYKEKKWYYLMLILLIATFFPVVGNICDPSGGGRWVWYWDFLIAVAVLLFAENIEKLDVQKKRLLYIVPIGWLLLSIGLGWRVSIEGLLQWGIGFALVTFIILTESQIQIGILAAVCFSILVNVHYTVGFGEGDYTKDFVDNKHSVMNELVYNYTAKVTENIPKNEFYRLTCESQERNAGLLAGVSSIRYYYSLSNPYMTRFMKELNVEFGNTVFNVASLDHRLALEALASVKYDMDGRARETYLPFAFVQESVMPESEAEKLRPLEKQQAMTEMAIIEDGYAGNKNFDFVSKCNYEELLIQDKSDGVDILEKGVLVTKENAEIEFQMPTVAKGEAYICIDNISISPYSQLEEYEDKGLLGYILPYEKRKLSFYNRNKTEEIKNSIIVTAIDERDNCFVKSIDIYNKNFNYYYGKNSFMSYLGDVSKGRIMIKISFPERGYYSWDSIRLETLSKEHQIQSIGEKKATVLGNWDMHNNNYATATNSITGQIKVKDTGVLVCSVPFSTGWKVYVDGEKEKVYRANYMYVAVPITKGEHTVEFQYETPFLKMGAVLTLISWMVYSGSIIWNKRKR